MNVSKFVVWTPPSSDASGFGAIEAIRLPPESADSSSLVRCRGLDHGNSIPSAPGLAVFGHVIEEREQPVVVLLRDRVELVVVAAGALERQSEPSHAERTDSVRHVLDAVLLLDDPALGINHVIPIESGCDALLKRRSRQQIARQLLEHELVVRQVGVERADNPVPPTPH